MKCDTCKFKKQYTTGFDEYPAYMTFEYCFKGHWEGNTYDDSEIDNWENCVEYEKEDRL